MTAVSILFLFVCVMVLALISLAIFFIIFGLIKKMKGFVIAGVALIVLFIACIVMLFLLNFGVNM